MSARIVDDGDSAFPTNKPPGYTNCDRMTLRDYFAAKAMVGLCHFWVQVKAKATINDPEPEIIARMAYEYADAMLKARTA